MGQINSAWVGMGQYLFSTRKLFSKVLKINHIFAMKYVWYMLTGKLSNIHYALIFLDTQSTILKW
jgi:hypothetical protein